MVLFQTGTRVPVKIVRILEIGAVLFLAALGTWQLATRPLDDRLEAMLPEDTSLRRSLKLLQDTPTTSGKVLIEVRLADTTIPHDRFVQALDRLVTELQSPLISRIVTPTASAPSPDDLRAISRYAPQLLNAASYSNLEERITETGVEKALKGIRRALVNPQFMLLSSDWFRSDPLGARATALKPLETLGRSTGYRATIRDGHFFSEDLRAAMLVIETPVLITDHAGSEAMIAFIRERLGRLPAGMESTIVAGHLHTLSNQRIIRRDLGWTSTLATVFFVSLFLICFRDIRSVLIFIIPPVGILIGISIIRLTGAPITAVVLGMTSMLAGVAIDYGIHVYVALSARHKELPTEDVLQRLRHPLMLSAFTTIAPLASLLFSSIPGYRQLGLLGSCTLLFCLFLALRILPLFFSSKKAQSPSVPSEPSRRILSTRAVIVFYLAFLTISLFAASQLHISLDFANLDGTEQAILKEEQAFLKRWHTGPGDTAILAVWSTNQEEARRANDLLYKRLQDQASVGASITSIAPVWPSEQTRRERVALWSDFWSRNAGPLRERLDRIAPTYGFSTNAFEPFFESLAQGTDVTAFPLGIELLSTLSREFTRKDASQLMLLSFYTGDAATAIDAIKDLPGNHACVSRRTLQQDFAAAIRRDLSRQTILSLSAMGLLVVIMVRGFRAILLVLIPPVTGIICMLSGLTLAGKPLNPVSMISLLLLVGILIDYGVFMLEAWQHDSRTMIGRGLTLAWLTTAGGAALLLVAQHPVLFTMGLSLSVGVTCGYASARWVVWPAAQLLKVPRHRDVPARTSSGAPQMRT